MKDSQVKKGNFYATTYMVDFRRPGHNFVIQEGKLSFFKTRHMPGF